MSSYRAPIIGLAVTALAITSLIFTAPVFACSCTYMPTVPEAKASAVAVFTGEVIEIADDVDQYEIPVKRVVLQVDAIWKGDLSDQVTLFTGANDGVCGNHYELGVDFLVYAQDIDFGDPVRLYTHSCGRTGWAENNPDFGELGPPLSVSARMISWGAVKQIWR
jgi:hypothetical protein